MFHQVFICDEPQVAGPPDELVLADVVKHDPGGEPENENFNLKMETEDIKIGSDCVTANAFQEMKLEIKGELMDEEPPVILPDLDLPEDPEACRIKYIQKEKDEVEPISNIQESLMNGLKENNTDPIEDFEKTADKKMQSEETPIEFANVTKLITSNGIEQETHMATIKIEEIEILSKESSYNVDNSLLMADSDAKYIMPDVHHKIPEENTDIMLSPLYDIKKEDTSEPYPNMSILNFERSPNIIQEFEVSSDQIGSPLSLHKTEGNLSDLGEDNYSDNSPAGLQSDEDANQNRLSLNKKINQTIDEKSMSMIRNNDKGSFSALLKIPEEDIENNSSSKNWDTCSDREEKYNNSKKKPHRKSKHNLSKVNERRIEPKQKTESILPSINDAICSDREQEYINCKRKPQRKSKRNLSKAKRNQLEPKQDSKGVSSSKNSEICSDLEEEYINCKRKSQKKSKHNVFQAKQKRLRYNKKINNKSSEKKLKRDGVSSSVSVFNIENGKVVQNEEMLLLNDQKRSGELLKSKMISNLINEKGENPTSLKETEDKRCSDSKTDYCSDSFSDNLQRGEDDHIIDSTLFYQLLNKETISNLTPNNTYNEELLQCKLCNRTYDTEKQFRYHMSNSTCYGFRKRRNLQCDICGKLYSCKEKLENHTNAHNNARPYKCFDCDKRFTSKTLQQLHYKNVHEQKRVRYICCYCGLSTPMYAHLIAHEETHRLPEGAEIPKPFKCLQCGRGYISNYKLTCHKRKHRLKKCSKCSEEFITETLLKAHLEDIHNIVKQYNCDKCSKTFKCVEGLKLHSISHSTVLQFFCDICDKGFKMKHHIRQHMITHSDERPISCPNCKETFKRQTHLKQHMAAVHGQGKKR